MLTNLVLLKPNLPADEAALCGKYWARSTRDGRLRYAHGIDALALDAAHQEIFARHGLAGMSERRSWLMRYMARVCALAVRNAHCACCDAPLPMFRLHERTPGAPYGRCARCEKAARTAAPARTCDEFEDLFDEHERRQLRAGRHLSLRTRAEERARHDARMDWALRMGFAPLGAPVALTGAEAGWLLQALVRAAPPGAGAPR